MTLEEYEKVKAEKRKALLEKSKVEERKVKVDKELAKMQAHKKAEMEDIFALSADKHKGKKKESKAEEAKEKEAAADKVKKVG
jgi:plasminogen activator inhibitor 1 RNA-binding protein